MARSDRLRAIPDAPVRAVGYIRVSKERGEMISPELQLAAISEHCERNGYELVETLTDLDLTGRFWKRRKVETAVQMIEAKTVDVLVVWKWSRVARNRLDWNIAVDRVESVGGRLDSATEPVDTTTSSGRFARGMLAEVAAFESERIGESWKETHAKRLRDGLPANGKPRFGYRTVGGRHEPDPETGTVLASLYRRYIAGESVYSLVRWLNDHGYRTAAGYSATGPGPWSDRSLRRVLDTGFGAGLLTVHGDHVTGAHEPVIDQAEWEAYLAARSGRRVHRNAERSQYLLSGLVRCACGSAMTGGQFGHARAPKFRCTRAKEQGSHPGGYVMMSYVEKHVLGWLRGIAADLELSTDAALAQQSHADRRRTDAEALQREIEQLGEQLTTLTVQLAAGVVPASAYEPARDRITGSIAELEHRKRIAQVEADMANVQTKAADLVSAWPSVAVEHRRGSLRELISYVEVTPGRPRAQLRVVPIWAGESKT